MTFARGQRGFTLLEVLLALALAAGLLAGLFYFYRQVLDVRRTVLREIEILSAERIFMDRIGTELRSALPNAHYGLVMEGTDQYVIFHYADGVGPGAWAEPQSRGWRPQSDVKRVTYHLRYDEEAGEEGEAILGVERWMQDVLAPPLEEDEVDEEAGHQALFDQFRFLSLRYWTGSTWVYGWAGATLPAAVEVRLGVKPLPEGLDPMDYPFESFRRVIALPGAMHLVEGDPIDVGDSGGLFMDDEEFDLP